jgi:flagellar hook-associated protein 3 FlgL
MTTTTFMSTRSMNEAARLTLLKSQVQLAAAEKEAITGRKADVGLALGYQIGQVVSLRQDYTRLQSITASNDLASFRLSVTQSTMSDIISEGNTYLSSLVTYVAQPDKGVLAMGQAKAGLNALIDKLNTNNDGAFLFAGINSDVQPIGDYYAAGAASRTSVTTAFATLGPPDQITPAAMQAFLDGPFAALFDDPAWGANWSSAADQNIKSRISSSEMIETSTNANADPFRALMSAYTMVADLDTSQLSQDTFKVVAKKAADLASSALTKLASLQGTLGVAEERIATSNERMSIQINLIQTQINVMEGVDPNEASLRVTALSDQIELSYALTGRLQRLNILDYI